MAKFLASIVLGAASLSLVADCGGDGQGTAHAAREACQVLKTVTPSRNDGERRSDIKRSADLLREAHVNGAQDMAADLDAFLKKPLDWDYQGETPLDRAWIKGTGWCLRHDLPGDPDVTTTLKTSPSTASPTTPPPTTSAPAPTAPPTTRYVPPPPPSVTYDLTGQGSVQVTLQNASGGTEQFVTRLPYHLDLGPAGTFGGLSGFVYISAQLQDTGTVTCTIKKGEQVIQTATSTGQYVIATCSGSV